MTDTLSAPLSAEELDELETYLRTTSPFGYSRTLRAISMARDGLALRSAAARLADEAQRMVDHPGHGPGGLQQPLADLREALSIGAITINDYRRKVAEQELAAGRATAGTKEGQDG